ncbi:hypothetical protein TA3x_005476 [Tundrisphaera sp. TA3]|uniref:hypothetical protein n=1 Tax=Tundrisphaera sp. TA3 TaxID=3435775 RepID=UPI003EBA0463
MRASTIAMALAALLPALPPDGGPTPILRGEGDAEVAPHGEGNVYAPDVIRDGPTLRMWYGGQGRDGHDRIALAESSDGGATWAHKGVVLADDRANHVNDPSVVRVGGLFFLFYTRTARDVVDRIDVAISADGRAWEPKGVALDVGPPGSWDSLSVGRPSVIHEGGLFRMWYDGRRDFPPGAPVKGVPISPASARHVGYATSRDGLHWTRSGPSPVFDHDAGGVDVKRVGGSLVMLYESRDGTRAASGTDGLSWTDRGLLAPRSGAPIDAFGHVTPFLLLDPGGGPARLYVGAASATTWDRNQIAWLAIDRAGLDRMAARP